MPASMTLLAHHLATVDRSLSPPQPAMAAATGELLLAQQDRLRRLVHRLLGWPGAACRGELDDLVQDVLLLAWRQRGSFRGDSAVATWLTRIAIRKVQHHLRWRRVRDRLRGWLPHPLEALAVEPPCARAAGDEIQALQRALARLAADDRAVLVLRYLEDRPIDELAAVFGCSRAAVDQRLTRARQRLRVLLPQLEDA